jgi:hypothetical protein
MVSSGVPRNLPGIHWRRDVSGSDKRKTVKLRLDRGCESVEAFGSLAGPVRNRHSDPFAFPSTLCEMRLMQRSAEQAVEKPPGGLSSPRTKTHSAVVCLRAAEP